MRAALLTAAALLVAAWPAGASPRQPPRAVVEFRQANPCPATGKTAGACPGYVVSRTTPPCADGEDARDDMQWQTRAEARLTARWEREYCRFHKARLATAWADPAMDRINWSTQ